MKRLEAIVESLESEEQPLENLMKQFEEGIQMAKLCQAKLADADLKIRQLEKTAAGEFQLKPADVSDPASMK